MNVMKILPAASGAAWQSRDPTFEKCFWKFLPGQFLCPRLFDFFDIWLSDMCSAMAHARLSTQKNCQRLCGFKDARMFGRGDAFNRFLDMCRS